MPKVVKSYGVHLTDDVVKIQDVMLHRPKQKPKPPRKPRPAPPGEQMPPLQDGQMPVPEELQLPGQDGAVMPEEGEGGFEAEEPMGAPVPLPEPEEYETYDEEYDEGPSGHAGGYGGGMHEEVLQSAMAEAGRIIEEAVHNAEARRNEILSGIEEEAEALRRQAYEEGKLEGISSVVGETRDLAAEIERMVATFEGERAGFEHEYEEQLKWLAFEIASKVLAKKVAQNDAEMLEMVSKAVQGVRNEAWVRVEVSAEMTHLIDRLMELFERDENISVQPARTDPGTVMIETPSGVIDASLKTQLANLREYFIKTAG